MNQSYTGGRPGNIRKRVLTFMALSSIAFLLSSCVSFDSQQEGVVGSVYDIEGVKILMDSGADRLLAFAVRNDSDAAKTLRLRAVGGEIGWDTGGTTGYKFGSVGTGNVHRAAYLVSPGEMVLNPGDEIMGQVFLNNWYLANKDFSSKFEFRIVTDEERHMVAITADQDDIFVNSKDMFQQNKLGRNNPARYSSRHLGVDKLPRDYTLTIPQ